MHDDRIIIEGRCFLTNLDAKRAWAIRQAASETGFAVEVGDSIGEPLGYIGVWTLNISQDHGPFWKRYDELLKQEATQ